MYSQETRQFMPKERTPPLFPSLLSHTHTRSLWRKSLPVRRKRFRKKNVLGKSGKKRWRNNSPLFGNICLNVANGTTIVIMYPNCPRPVRPVEKLFTLTRGKKKEKIWEEYPFLRLVFSWALITQQGRKKTESFLRLVCRWCGVTFRMHAQACLRFNRPDIYISSTISETLVNIMGGKKSSKRNIEQMNWKASFREWINVAFVHSLVPNDDGQARASFRVGCRHLVPGFSLFGLFD